MSTNEVWRQWLSSTLASLEDSKLLRKLRPLHLTELDPQCFSNENCMQSKLLSPPYCRNDGNVERILNDLPFYSQRGPWDDCAVRVRISEDVKNEWLNEEEPMSSGKNGNYFLLPNFQVSLFISMCNQAKVIPQNSLKSLYFREMIIWESQAIQLSEKLLPG